MKLLQPVTGFIFAAAPIVPREELRRYMFWYKMNNHAGQRHLLGSFTGNPMYDSKFRDKLEYIRGLMSYKRIPWEESFYVVYHEELREARRLTYDQNYQRKLSKIRNAYTKARENIKNSTELFKDDLYRALEEDYKRHLEKAIASYEPDKMSFPEMGKPQ